MAIAWNADDDFAAVLDGLETVTWQRITPGGVVAVTLSAWRFTHAATDNDGAPGGASAERATWHLPWQDDPAPQVGDVLLDAASRQWNIVAVEFLRSRTRLRCGTVSV